MLSSNKPLTTLAKSINLNTWADLLNHVKYLAYGRNANREDFSLVLKEQQGSCSSKHALLKAIALENNLHQVILKLVVFKMNATNTPKIASTLKENNISFILEAHCFLQIDSNFIGATSSKSDYNLFKNDIVESQEIVPHQVIDYKVEFHKKRISTWLKEINSKLSFNDLWTIREACIQKLSE